MKRPFIFLSFILLLVNFLYGCGGSGDLSSALYPDSGNPGGSSITLSWQAPTTNEDNTPLTDLGGYRVYYSETSGVYTNSVNIGNVTNCSISGLPTGKVLYISVTALDTSGNESAFSNEVRTIL